MGSQVPPGKASDSADLGRRLLGQDGVPAVLVGHCGPVHTGRV